MMVGRTNIVEGMVCGWDDRDDWYVDGLIVRWLEILAPRT